MIQKQPEVHGDFRTALQSMLMQLGSAKGSGLTGVEVAELLAEWDRLRGNDWVFFTRGDIAEKMW